MLKKFKITAKNNIAIQAESADKEKKPLILSYKKNAYLLIQFRNSKVGEEINVDVEVGTSGNYWATSRTEVMSEMVKAMEVTLKEKNLNTLLAQGTV
jgi:hypothetical protein